MKRRRMIKMAAEIKYLTRDEFLYLRYLGTGKWHKDGLKLDRVKCLENYIKSFLKRMVWGEIDREAALKYAKQELKKIRGGE